VRVKLVVVVLMLLLGLYLVWLHSLNPQLLSLPLLGSLPPAPAILAALLLGAALAWALLLPRLRRLGREKRALEERLKGLEHDLGLSGFRPPDPGEPVIPDRTLSLEDLR
jgi:membrane protein implicated in regulation of membrane protease activity